MPRLPIDYSKTIIYKLVCRDLSVKELYVGATTNWVNRKGMHKYACNDETRIEYNFKVYQYIRANSGFENWLMIMVEKFPCETEHESAKRERFWTETLGATLNMRVQGRTQVEYKKTHTEQIAKNQAEYRAEHKEEAAEYQVEYRAKNKEQLAKQKVKYRAEHKEQLAKNKAEWYQENKEQLAEKRKEKYTCECGQILTISKKSRHNKSKKHINFIQVNGATALPLG